MDISFNINEKAMFKPTEQALSLLSAHFAESAIKIKNGRTYDEILDGYKKEVERNQGFLIVQMWTLMNVLGPHMSNGGTQLIIGNRIHLTKYNAVMTIKDE